MIIKVVELARINDAYTSLDEQEDKPSRFSLCETFLNTDHVIDFREIDPTTFRVGTLPDGLDERQLFTYVTLPAPRKGITVVCSPQELQKRINNAQIEPDLLMG
jgi:hypothetical protein